MRHRSSRCPKALLAAAACLALAGCGSSDDPTPTVAPATTPGAGTSTSIVGTATNPPATTPTATTPTPTTATTTATTSTTPSSGGSLIAGSSNGKRYRCIGPDLLHDLKAMSRRIQRGRTSLKRIRRELRQLKRRYPGNVAPPKVAQRYNYLVRKHNALLRLGNRRVRAYNGRLDRDCLHR